jgi:hypothetical protein
MANSCACQSQQASRPLPIGDLDARKRKLFAPVFFLVDDEAAWQAFVIA